jgi:hypothetical protein
MSWAMYEPVASLAPNAPARMPDQMKPVLQYKPENPAYSASPSPQPQPSPPPAQGQGQTKSRGWADISEYEEINDWVYIFIGILVTEVILLFLVRLFPELLGKYMNVWYNRFKLSAVIADIFILALGIGITRYVYTEFIYPKHDWNPLYFTATSLFVQVLHDLLFYLGVIQQLPKGHNAMIDVFKEYASAAGTRAILGDSALMISSVGLAMIFKGMEAHATAFIGILALYAVPYILETRNDYSTLG